MQSHPSLGSINPWVDRKEAARYYGAAMPDHSGRLRVGDSLYAETHIATQALPQKEGRMHRYKLLLTQTLIENQATVGRHTDQPFEQERWLHHPWNML